MSKFKVGDELIDTKAPRLGTAKVTEVRVGGYLKLYWYGTCESTKGDGSRSDDTPSLRKLTKLEKALK